MMKRGAPIWEEQGDDALKAEAARQRAEAKAKSNGQGRETKRRIELVPFGEMKPNLKDADRVKGLLGSAQLSAVYGPPGCGKTFLAIEIALRVATGRVFFRRRTKQGGVVYLAAEAGRRIFNRVAAWRMRRMRDGDGDVPFFAVPIQVNLVTTGDDLDVLIGAIKGTCGDEAPALIVIDTIARVMGGGNENSPDDMGALVASADRLRDEFGAHVMLIHHSGKDAGRGLRGHSSLHGAVDTEIEVSRDDEAELSTAKVVKQRDGEIGEKVHFILETVVLGTNEETGDEVTSCIVSAPDRAQVAEAERAAKRKLGKAESIALDTLRHVLETDGEAPPASANCPSQRWVTEDAWRRRCYAAGISHGKPRAQQAAFQHACQVLLNENLIGLRDGFAWLR